MTEERDYILAKDGVELCTAHWSTTNPKAVCCLIHGLGEHIERYRMLAQHLNEQQIAVTGIDLRGHGRSKGKRGHSRSYENLLSDLEELMKFTRSIYIDSPMFIFGHSLGGNIVANYVKNERNSELSGFILSSPFFRVSFDPPRWKVVLAQLMDNVWPSLTQPTGLETAALSRIPAEVKKYEDDPMVHDKISTSMYLGVTQMGEAAISNKNALSTNGLVYHGNADRLTSYHATKEFYSNTEKHLTFKTLEGGYHELHNDSCQEEVFLLISDFIDENL